MFQLSDFELNEYIQEDVPYLDITTHLQDIKNKYVTMDIFTREDIIVSCTEEAAKIVQMLNCRADYFIPSSQKAFNGDTILSFSGDYNDVHKAWRSAQVILEYSCKIATYTKQMKEKISLVNDRCELLTTRKTFPFAKKFCIKSIVTAGAMPHRLNLAETILFFSHHRIFYDTPKQFYLHINKIKQKAPEKKIVAETCELLDAISLMIHGVDVLQCDKVDLDTLKNIVNYRDEKFSNVKILAAGGIDLLNCQEYAKTGIDAIVTSKVYFCGMANIGTRMEIVK